MSYGDDDRNDYYRELDRRDEYNREMDKRDQYNRDADRRYDDFMDDMKLDKERRDRDTEEAIGAIQRGDIAWGAHKLGLTDFAIDYLQKRSVEEQSSGAQLVALNQLAALGVSEQSDVVKILHDPSLSVYDRIYLAVSTVLMHLDEEITVHLDALRDTKDFDGEMSKYRELSQKRTDLQGTLTQLYEEENERLRKAF